MQTFIFDFDGTLADSKQCSVLATQQAFQAMDLAVPTTECIEYYMGIPIEQSFKEMASTSLDDVAFEALLNAFRQAYKELENDTLTVFPYIPKVLRILKEHNKSLYVVSSKNQMCYAATYKPYILLSFSMILSARIRSNITNPIRTAFLSLSHVINSSSRML